ncbi:hypothetical protein Y032_0220g2522 [Ancylostoma ceylanicum]|uniref:Uncharacterized protein n=1 Tax=Ancylostoma ceylanicum TaxID=53326 RepID=A0A016SJ82_9BILA|nr:hypothetical protein Y032_0220g2522 [Ancylostoma ceylanicum]
MVNGRSNSVAVMHAISLRNRGRGSDTYRLPRYIAMDRCQTELIARTLEDVPKMNWLYGSLLAAHANHLGEDYNLPAGF